MVLEPCRRNVVCASTTAIGKQASSKDSSATGRASIEVMNGSVERELHLIFLHGDCARPFRGVTVALHGVHDE
jgi:hypothetical protein